MWTQIRLQSDLGPHCLPVCKNRFEKFARIISSRQKQTTFSDADFLGVLRVLSIQIIFIGPDKLLFFFNQKLLIFYLFLYENICCGYSSEAPHRGTSNEYPQPIFSRRNKKILVIPLLLGLALMAQLDAPPTGDQEVAGSTPAGSATFVEIWSWNIFTVILSLPLIQEGQLSVSGERKCTILVNHLEDLTWPVKVWLGKLTMLDMTPLGWLDRKTSTLTNKPSYLALWLLLSILVLKFNKIPCNLKGYSFEIQNK